MKMLDQYKAARRAGTPLMAIKTFDPEALMQSIQKLSDKVPLIQHDCIRGWRMRNKAGQEAIDKALSLGSHNIEETIHYSGHLELAESLPFDPECSSATNPVLFVLNAHNYLDKPDFVQALWNLRDVYKDSLRTIVLLGPDFKLPAELRQDILVLDELLPTPQELGSIVERVTKANNITIDGTTRSAAVNALRGLAAFPAEQTVAMCLKKGGLDIDGLWDRKRQQIQQYKGLTVWRGGEAFDALGGLEAIKAKFRRILNGKRPPKVIVWVEEGEKQAGLNKSAGGDLSGTSSDQLSVLLTEIVDQEYTGAILDGVPGGGKSQFAKSFGNEAGVLTIRLDLGGSKGDGLVGQAENEIRANLKMIEAIGGKGGAFFIFTSNNAVAMDSALKSRMTKGVWFFDTPDEQEKAKIWSIYFTPYPDVDPNQAKPDDAVWTGREIRACVMTAWEEGISLVEAARDIIPVAVSDSNEIERMRQTATGRYNSASYAGSYNKNRVVEEQVPQRTRRVVEEEAE